MGRYEGFKSSGKLETIEDDSLKQKILSYYQQGHSRFVHYGKFYQLYAIEIAGSTDG